MKKLFASLFAVALFAIVPFAHATEPVFQVGIVEGVVTGSDSNPVNAAAVAATCNGVTVNGSTNTEGFYFLQYDSGVCTTGMNVAVTATKGSENGAQNGVMQDNGSVGMVHLDVAIVNVPMVPEFGLFTGAIALLGSAGSFAILKRKV